MRLAYFSPLPPERTGVSEYSSDLLPELARHGFVDAFVDGYVPTLSGSPEHLRVLPAREFESRYEQGFYDEVVYHIANNPDHSYIYRRAIRIPGLVFLHDFNLHYLVVDETVARNDWPGYFNELRYNAGEEPIAHASRAQRYETGPQYDKYNLNRRILENSRGLIVNNGFLRNLVDEAPVHAPTIVLPHGVPRPPREIPSFRSSLGLEGRIVVGAFGFMKPYKRIHSILRAVRLIREPCPDVHVLLVGEEHPAYSLDPLIEELGLKEQVHRVGFVSIPEMWGYIQDCDICCNLRFPTIGESSGPLMKIMALGKPVVVSSVGSYDELPDDACVKTPAGDEEVEPLANALAALARDAAARRRIGEKAAAWALADERSWRAIAAGVVAFSERLTRTPHILSLSPPAIRAGSQDFSLAAVGGPWGNPSMYWNGVEMPTTVLSAGELRATIPAAEAIKPAVTAVSIRDSAGASLGERPFRVMHPPSRIRAITPEYAVAGDGELLLTVHGGPFVSSNVACWNGQRCPTKWLGTRELIMWVSPELMTRACRVMIDVIDPLQQCAGLPYAVRSTNESAEPALSLEMPAGFCVLEVRAVSGALDGRWEMSVAPDAVGPVGALHFGAAAAPAHVPPLSCTFSLENRGPVRVSLNVYCSAVETAGLRAEVRKCANGALVDRIPFAAPQLEFTIELEAGCYMLLVEGSGDGPLAIGQIESPSITAAMHLRGWIEEGMVGFAAFHLPAPARVDVSTRCRSLGAFGADGLLLNRRDSG